MCNSSTQLPTILMCVSYPELWTLCQTGRKRKNQGIAKYHLYNILYRIEREKYMFMITIMIIIIYNLSPP